MGGHFVEMPSIICHHCYRFNWHIFSLHKVIGGVAWGCVLRVSMTAHVSGDGGSQSFNQAVLSALQAQCADSFTTVTNIAGKIEFIICTFNAATGEAAPVWLK
jgi:hypothetical protein